MFPRLARVAAVAAVVAAGGLTVSATPAQASPYGGFHASCSTGSGNEYWWHDMSWSSFITKGNSYYDQGYRITQMDVSGHGVTAVWRPGTGAQRVRGGMSIDELKSWDDTYTEQGLRMSELDRDGDDFYAVWRPGTGNRFWRTNFGTWADFVNQDTVLFNQGYRLVDIVIESESHIGGLWRSDQGTSGQLWNYGVLAADLDANNKSTFQKLNEQRQAAGWELTFMVAHPNDAYRVGVWRYRGGSFSQSTGQFMNVASMQGWEAACRSAGKRITALDVT
jgi:hypothetical protein